MKVDIGFGFVLLARLGALFLRALEYRAELAIVPHQPGVDGQPSPAVLPELPRPLGWG